jgi:hypothetical protein
MQRVSYIHTFLPYMEKFANERSNMALHVAVQNVDRFRIWSATIFELDRPDLDGLQVSYS